MNIISFNTKSEQKNVTYRDVLRAQVVFVSSAFMVGSHYHGQRVKTGARRLSDWELMRPGLEPELRENRNETEREKQQRLIFASRPALSRRGRKGRKEDITRLDLSGVCPVLNLFHWRRIILDEAPDYLCLVKAREAIMELSS